MSHFKILMQSTYKYIELAKKLHRSSQHTIFAFQLVLEYLQKQPSNFKEVGKYLQNEVYFYADDYDEKYQIQVKLFEILLKEVSLKIGHWIKPFEIWGKKYGSKVARVNV